MHISGYNGSGLYCFMFENPRSWPKDEFFLPPQRPGENTPCLNKNRNPWMGTYFNNIKITTLSQVRLQSFSTNNPWCNIALKREDSDKNFRFFFEKRWDVTFSINLRCWVLPSAEWPEGKPSGGYYKWGGKCITQNCSGVLSGEKEDVPSKKGTAIPV